MSMISTELKDAEESWEILFTEIFDPNKGELDLIKLRDKLVLHGKSLDKKRKYIILKITINHLTQSEITTFKMDSGYIFDTEQEQEILKTLISCKNLKTVHLDSIRDIPKEVLKHLASTVSHLFIDGNFLSEQAVSIIAESQTIRVLNINAAVTIISLNKISTMKNLKSLAISFCLVDLKELIEWLNVTSIERLEMYVPLVKNEMDDLYNILLSHPTIVEVDIVGRSTSLQIPQSEASFAEIKIHWETTNNLVCMSNYEAVEPLLDHKQGKELLESLKTAGYHPNSYRYTSARSNQKNPILNWYIGNENLPYACLVVETFSDLDPNLKDWEDKTALIMAAKMFVADPVIKSLLRCFSKKLDLNAQDKDGCTALHYLCAYGKLSLIQTLIDAGADQKLKDKKGRTPFDYFSLDKDEIVQFLSSVGINANRDLNAWYNDILIPWETTIENPMILVKKYFFYQKEQTLEILKQLQNNNNNSPFSQKLITYLEKHVLKNLSGKSILQSCLEAREDAKVLSEVITTLETFQITNTIGNHVIHYLYDGNANASCNKEDFDRSNFKSAP